MAHLTTVWRLSECLMKYEAWFQFTKHPFVRYLWCGIKYVWCSCSLSWVANRGWAAVMTIKAETGSSKHLRDEWEGSWMDPTLPARNINRNVMWPVTIKCLSIDKTTCSSALLTPSALSKFECLFFLLDRRGWAQQFSSAGELVGITEGVTTPPTQSWSCVVFKTETQSWKSSFVPGKSTFYSIENQVDSFVWLHSTWQRTVTLKSTYMFAFNMKSDL